MTVTDLQLAALTGGLVRHFEHVATTRMADVPIVNPAVGVEAVGFERTDEGFLGVLVTPWFISLVLLPLEGDDWRDRKIGSEITHSFASGNYVFQVAGEAPDVIGPALNRLTDRGHVPEALRIAHLIGSAVRTGESGRRA